MSQPEVTAAKHRATIRGSWRELARLQRSSLQHWNEAVKLTAKMELLMFLSQLLDNTQPASFTETGSVPVAVKSGRFEDGLMSVNMIYEKRAWKNELF